MDTCNEVDPHDLKRSSAAFNLEDEFRWSFASFRILCFFDLSSSTPFLPLLAQYSQLPPFHRCGCMGKRKRGSERQRESRTFQNFKSRTSLSLTTTTFFSSLPFSPAPLHRLASSWTTKQKYPFSLFLLSPSHQTSVGPSHRLN